MRQCLAGSELEGLFRTDRGLLSVGTRATATIPDFPFDGITQLLEVGPDYVLEREPVGVPMSSLSDIDWVDSATVAASVADVLARVHAAGRHLGGLRPELVYVTPDDDLVFTALTPRPSLFFAGLDHGDQGVAPAFPTVWMAPEVARGGAAGPAADVFILGAMLQAWIMGEHPFSGVTQTEQMMAIAMARRAPYSGPSEVGDLVEAATALSPASRPSAEELSRALRNWACA